MLIREPKTQSKSGVLWFIWHFLAFSDIFYGIHYQKSVLIFQWRALNYQKLYQFDRSWLVIFNVLTWLSLLQNFQRDSFFTIEANNFFEFRTSNSAQDVLEKSSMRTSFQFSRLKRFKLNRKFWKRTLLIDFTITTDAKSFCFSI